MKALVLFSGGIDSTTALGLAIKKYGKDQVIALSVSYGQKHDKEISPRKKFRRRVTQSRFQKQMAISL